MLATRPGAEDIDSGPCSPASCEAVKLGSSTLASYSPHAFRDGVRGGGQGSLEMCPCGRDGGEGRSVHDPTLQTAAGRALALPRGTEPRRHRTPPGPPRRL